MWKVQKSSVVSASSACVWSLWQDVTHWNEWDRGLRWSRIDGEFQVGTKGVLKPTSGPASHFTLVTVEQDRRFTDVAKLPFCQLEFDHVIEPHAAGCKITHTVTMSGPLTFLFSRLLGRQLRHDLERAVAELALLANRREHTSAATGSSTAA